MADSLIITALRSKRAELSGDLQQAEARIARLHTEIAAVDVTLRIFDPEQKPALIRPKVKRRVSTRFRAGELTRAALDVLRGADRALTVREIAEAVLAAHGLDTSARGPFNALMANVRNAVVRPRDGMVREGEEGEYR